MNDGGDDNADGPVVYLEGQLLWASVGGQVSDVVAGLALPGAALQLARAAGGPLVASMRSRPDGSYCFSNLAPGDYRVTVNLAGYVSQTQPVTVDGRKFFLLSFPLSPVTHSSSSSAGPSSSSSGASSTGTA